MRKEISEFGTTRYYNEKGQIHREDGPAALRACGSKFWFQHGQLHREDGPAIEYADGRKEYWINGKRIKTVSK